MNFLGAALKKNIGYRMLSIEKWLLDQIFKIVGPVPLRLAVEEGPESAPSGISPVGTIVVRDISTLVKLIADPEMEFGEGYAQGRIRVEGNLPDVLEAIYRSSEFQRNSSHWYQHLLSGWMNRMQDNSYRGSRRHIHHHYDLGNDFYSLWLDNDMVYTCAYFPSPDVSLEMAQRAKLDYICRKLRLKAGETVLETGCGWGALALHMAEHYGVSVKAFNISHEQVLYARQKAAERDLQNRVEFVEDDYRNVTGHFDVFVSVGMLEHVGRDHFREFGDVIHRSVNNRGRGLLHFIGRNRKNDFSRWIRRRIFPGAYAPALNEVAEILEPFDYSVVDVENLRHHYAKTLEHWLERFEKSSEQVLEMFDASFQRAWTLYLAGSLAAFRAGALQLFQICFAGSKNTVFPWTRTDLYVNTHDATEKTEWSRATF